MIFLSTLSLRRATSWQYIFFHPPTDFYPRSPCGERPRIARSTSSRPWNFYPRSPCGERPICWPRSVTQRRNFYPRSPCGERRRQADRVQHHRHFYPRSPCGERHFVVQHLLQLRIISIHALLAESDSILRGWEGLFPLFLSTLSLRRATCGGMGRHWQIEISIHALLAESDAVQLAVCANAAGISIHALLAESDGAGSRVCTTCFNFYPRSPCGERRQCSMYFRLRSRFLSTLSLRRATQFFSYSKMRYQFLSTLSLRRATTITGIIYSDRKISIHALLAESD